MSDTRVLKEARTAPPAGLTLARLSDSSGPEHAAARRFCLDVIKEYYGFDYRTDWHADLDSLLLDAEANQFSTHNRGGFWTLAAPDGALVATAAVSHLGWKPALAAAFAERYATPERIGMLGRVYVRSDQRGDGLGRWLNGLCEDQARLLGYDTMYLHASSHAAATIAFWKSRSYAPFSESMDSIHFDKPLVWRDDRLEPSPDHQSQGRSP